MVTTQSNMTNLAVENLVSNQVASRVHNKDASLYEFTSESYDCASNYMGWTDLASKPPCKIKVIKELANKFYKAGMRDVVLIGQGGSTQAAMTITKFYRSLGARMRFHVLDSDSPVRLRTILDACDLNKTIVIAASKSGGTLEMRSLFCAIKDRFLQVMNEQEFLEHMIAITDPETVLAQQALDQGWAGLLYGEPSVGGRFSALSVFGLLPAALVGVPLKKFMKQANIAEKFCSTNSPDNPAIQLSAFLFDNYCQGRNKIAYVSQERGRVLGLWIEQLIAESTGKDGQGILPYLEVEPVFLAKDLSDRAVITYTMPGESADALRDYEASLSCISQVIPRFDFRVNSIEELAQHFVMWEYATAFCGYLMQVCPFDQPDVASAKACVLDILQEGLPPASTVDSGEGFPPLGRTELRLSPELGTANSLRKALELLFKSIGATDYFAINAFLPFVSEDRKRALEDLRFAVADQFDIAACLEIGPRYLHSTGQLQKGGPSEGVYLIISADEDEDVKLTDLPAQSLGQLAKAQAAGDASILMERGKRCLHVHLSSNYGVTLRAFTLIVADVLANLSND